MTLDAGAGIGIGVEIAATVLRVACVHAGREDPLTALAEIHRRHDGRCSLADALIRAAVEVAAPAGAPLRLAWFPTGAMIESEEVSGRHPASVAAAVARWSASGDGAVTLVDAGTRRWAVVIRWTSEDVARAIKLARQAGFDEASCEPSPFVVARLLGTSRASFIRDDGDGGAWCADVVDGVVVAASATAPATGAPPTLTPRPPWPWPGKDVDIDIDVDRYGVAIGAALAAAGAVPTARAIRPLTSGHDRVGWRRWSVEYLPDGQTSDAGETAPTTARRWPWRRRRRNP